MRAIGFQRAKSELSLLISLLLASTVRSVALVEFRRSTGGANPHTRDLTMGVFLFCGSDSVSCHLLVSYQVKRLLDLDFIPLTQSRSDHKTRKELPRKSSMASDPLPQLLFLEWIGSEGTNPLEVNRRTPTSNLE